MTRRLGGTSRREREGARAVTERFGVVHAEHVHRAQQDAPEIVTRTLPVSSARLRERFEGDLEAARTWVDQLGGSHPDGTMSYYEPVGRNLILRNVEPVLGIVERALASVVDTPSGG